MSIEELKKLYGFGSLANTSVNEDKTSNVDSG